MDYIFSYALPNIIFATLSLFYLNILTSIPATIHVHEGIKVREGNRCKLTYPPILEYNFVSSNSLRVGHDN